MAHPGDLDTTFGSGGKKTVNFGGTDAARPVLVQPNGRVVVAGGGGPASSFCVVRLRSANGTLDPTFGSGGKRVIDFGTDDESVYGAALQPDGKIVLAGDSRLQPAVVRLKANGTLDTSFDGDGRKLFSWGAIGRVTAVVVAPNGKILLGGFSGPEGGNIQVARLNANGAFDTTFGTAGIAAVDFGGTEFGEAIARQVDGRILVVGRSSAGGAVVARLRATGVLDPDFGGDGRVTLPGGGGVNAVLVQPDRNIVVAGNASGSATMTVTRLRPDGSLDTGFGSGGTTTVAFGSLANPVGGAARQPDGKIVIAGYTQDGEDVAVARLNANGSLDATFGAGGKATVDFGAATFGNAVALAPNGRIVVAGQKTGGDDFAVARLRG
jgi:uncharacterized delta-60 repeat protein